MAFKDILGNERQKKILRRALQRGRIPNSLLFSGIEGIGKRSMAFVLAKAMNCERKKDDACEVCTSCKSINKSNHPDVMLISPEKNIIKIEQMRELKQTAYLKPMMAKKRVFIVAEAEKMNEEAANSLLKVLEEPPLISHIILVTTNLDALKPTIKSRCQILNFQPISKEDIEKILLEKGFKKERARAMSLVVGGNLKKALNLDWEEILAKRARAWDLFLSLLGEGKITSFLTDYSSSRGQTKEELEEIFEILSSYCRDIILIKENGDIQLVINTPSGKMSVHDDSYIRKAAIRHRIPYITTLQAALAAAKGIAAYREGKSVVKSLQSYHADIV